MIEINVVIRILTAQLRGENPCVEIPPAIKLDETEEVSEEATVATLRRGIGYYSAIQAHDGHWPAESAGPLFFLPPLVCYIHFKHDRRQTIMLKYTLFIYTYIRFDV